MSCVAIGCIVYGSGEDHLGRINRTQLDRSRHKFSISHTYLSSVLHHFLKYLSINSSISVMHAKMTFGLGLSFRPCVTE